MKSAQRSMLFHSSLLTCALLVGGYFAWQHYHPPPPPTYQGQTLDQWVEDLDDPDYHISDRAADVLVDAGSRAVPSLLDAFGQGEIRLHRRAAAVLVRIGEPAASGLTAALNDNQNAQRSELALVRLGPLAVPALSEALKEERGADAAARILGLIGPPAVDAAPDLIALLQRRQAPMRLRREAAFALGRIGEPLGDIVPALNAALKDSKLEVRQQAAEALGWLGPPARPAVPALIAALKDDELKVARTACRALAVIGDEAAIPPLLAAFRSERAEVAPAAGWALWQMGPKADSIVPALLTVAQGPLDKSAPARHLLASFGPRVVPILKKTLRDGEAARREMAADVLGRIGPPARLAVPDLIATLKDKTPRVALMAAMALAQIDATRAGAAVPLLTDSLDVPGAAVALANIGPDARAAVPTLIAALKPRKDAAHQDALRAGARLALARIGKAAVPALIAALRDKREGVAPLAGEALAWVLPRPKEAVPALIQAIRDDRAHAEVYAVALSQFHSEAREAVPVLTELLTDPNNRAAAARTLVHIDPNQATKVVPLLVKNLQAPEEKQREEAALVLSTVGPAAKEAVPDLVKAVREGLLGEHVLLCLRRIGRDAVPKLVDLLKDKDVKYRRSAVMVLHGMGSAARAAVPALIAALSDSDNAVRVGAAHVLEQIGSEAAEAVPALSANLQTNDPGVRFSAAIALGIIGPAAKDARRPLLECVLDPDDQVRYAASLGLGRIDPHFTEAAPALRDALQDTSSLVRLGAIDSLSHIDPTNAVKEGVPILRALSDKPEELAVRFRAMEGLFELTPEQARQAVPWLTIEMTDPNPNSALYAARVLARIDPEQTSNLVLTLAGQLRMPIPDARQRRLRTLGEFGPKAREAVPEIERLLYDGEVWEEAIRALRAIYPARLKQLGIG